MKDKLTLPRIHCFPAVVEQRTEAWGIGVRQVAEKTMDLYTAVGVRLD